MTCWGTVKDGVVVLEDPKAIPEGTAVKVEPAKRRPRKTKPRNVWDVMLEHAGTVKGLPPDFARNHDHYIHGTPKIK